MTSPSRPTSLYLGAFSEDRFGGDSAARDRFRLALQSAREKARILAGEIPSSLPQFTQHDVSHMDALWELADVIAGEDAELNPAEGFVLGVAILVHDLAMSHAAYVLRGSSLRDHSTWPDVLATRIRARYGRAPIPSEMAAPPEDLAAEAERELLRTLHSESALLLPTAEWDRLDGTKDYLIEDPEIRSAYGRLVGRIAASHHWDKSLLAGEFGTPTGAISSAPASWTVDSLVIACLLRTADAAHIDASRTPDMLAYVRGITGESLVHWKFQAKVQRPFLQGDRLVFTAPAGFGRDEIKSWWLAFDVLAMIDGELHGVDNILADASRTRFRAKGVAHVDSPKDCQSQLPCNGWEPVAARVQVSDVAGLVRRLGGEGLYGKDPVAGIREIVTNACDAVLALSAFHEYRGTRLRNGRVEVTIVKDESGSWLSVEDNGIGMTPGALTTALLDFGRSSWLDPAITADNPGLIASKFQPVGKYGIGFFATFMLGNRVEVISRARSAGSADTWVLEFGGGLEHRPTLRRCDSNEELAEPGTRVRVLLDEALVNDGELSLHITHHGRRLGSYTHETRLADLLPWLLPASAVDIWTMDLGEDEPTRVVRADDWTSISGAQCLARVSGWGRPGYGPEEEEARQRTLGELGASLEMVFSEEGIPVGRIVRLGVSEIRAIGWPGADYSVVTAGPARTASAVHGIAGLLLGKPSRAARDAATPMVSADVMAEWATAQADQAATGEAADGGEWVAEMAEALYELGGAPGALRHWRTADGWLNEEQFLDWLRARTEVLSVHQIFASVRRGSHEEQIDLGPDVVVHELGFRPAMYDGDRDWPHGPERGWPGGRSRMLSDSLAAAWNLDPESAMNMVDSDEREMKAVGAHDGEEIIANVPVFRRSSLAGSASSAPTPFPRTSC
jgi:hypothetical protein